VVLDAVVACRVVVGAAGFLVGVRDLAGGGVVAGDAQDALGGGDDDRVGSAGTGDVLAADGDAGDAGFGGDAHGAGDGVARAFDHAVVGSADVAVGIFRRDDGRAVGLAVDGDGQLRRGDVAIGIGDGVADGLGQRLAVVEGLDRLQAVVELVRPGAVAVVHQRAVLGVAGVDDGRDRIGAERVVGQHAAGDRSGGIFP
jgi:hypothetical protein